MFFHTRNLQFDARPSKTDPLFAKKLQEVLGGQFGEITVMMQYLFQGWNCRGPAKYRDMLMSIGTEEIAHVEMLSTMIAQLLEGAPESIQGTLTQESPSVGAAMGGSNMQDAIVAQAMNPQHFIVAGLGATPTDSVGFPWSGRYMVASGNLMADFRHNLMAETMGRLQVARLYEMTDDPGVRDMLAFLIARDSYHQNQWIAALLDLEREGFDRTPVPMSFPREHEHQQHAQEFWVCSDGEAATEGSWAQGNLPDGSGEVRVVAQGEPLGPKVTLNPGSPMTHGTSRMPVPPSIGQATPDLSMMGSLSDPSVMKPGAGDSMGAAQSTAAGSVGMGMAGGAVGADVTDEMGTVVTDDSARDPGMTGTALGSEVGNTGPGMTGGYGADSGLDQPDDRPSESDADAIPLAGTGMPGTTIPGYGLGTGITGAGSGVPPMVGVPVDDGRDLTEAERERMGHREDEVTVDASDPELAGASRMAPEPEIRQSSFAREAGSSQPESDTTSMSGEDATGDLTENESRHRISD